MMTLRRLNSRAKTRGWRASFLAAALPLALAVGACGGDDSPKPTTVTTQDTANQPYPNLATVPDKPPPVSPEEIRASTAEGLAADRANAQYTGTLTAEGTAQPAASPPGPPPPEPEVKVIDEQDTTEERITEDGTVEVTEEVKTTVAETQGGVTTVETEVQETQVDETETGGGAIARSEVEEADADEDLSSPNPYDDAEPNQNDAQDADSVVDDTDSKLAEMAAQPSAGTSPAPAPTPAPSGTSTTGGVTEVTSISEICKVAEDWERDVYNCDEAVTQEASTPAPAPAPAPQPAPSQPSYTPAPAPQPAPAQPAPSYTQAPAPAPQPAPAQPAPSYTQAPAPAPQPAAPPPPAYSSTPPAPAPGTPQVAATPGQQAPLTINPPVGSTQPTPQPAPAPAYTAPQPAPAPAPGGVTQVTSISEACKVAEPWEREIYGCDNPAGTAPQQATAPSYTAPATTAQPGLVPPQGSVGSGHVDLVGVIFFANGSAALDGRDAQVLQQIAQLHKQYGGVIRVIGNASSRTGNMDPVDHELANFEVSMERAAAVATMLSRYGVATTSIITEARSDLAPIYHEFMPTGEAGNRRAEIYLEY